MERSLNGRKQIQTAVLELGCIDESNRGWYGEVMVRWEEGKKEVVGANGVMTLATPLLPING